MTRLEELFTKARRRVLRLLGRDEFDAWRERYSTSTFADQQAFYGQVWEKYPEQVSFAYGPFMECVRSLGPEELRVVELGGWQGALAKQALTDFPNITSWTNLEISRESVERSVCTSERYHPVALTAHVWEDRTQVPEAELAVATHTLEHLSAGDALAAVDALDPKRALYVEIPLDDQPTNWDHFFGSHILEVGWQEFEAALADRGYERAQMPDSSCRLYVR